MIAATHLDAVAFQIFSQSFKLVPTALFAYWLLGQALEPMQVGGGVHSTSTTIGRPLRGGPCARWHAERPGRMGSAPPLARAPRPNPAVLPSWVLPHRPSRLQWASIPVLALGVILVTVNNGGGAAGAAKSAAAAAVSSSSHGLDYVAGMVACSVSGLSSAYAGGWAGWLKGGCGAAGRGHGALQCSGAGTSIVRTLSLSTSPPRRLL